MFTGIIQAVVPITKIKEEKYFRTHYIRVPDVLLPNLSIGSSVAHNGCCLTVTNITDDVVSFDIIQETLRLTNLGLLKVGDRVNLECAVCLNGKISGHLMSGHIICTAELNKIEKSNNNLKMYFFFSNKEIMKYIFYKGYIGIDGVSLTVGETSVDQFCVHLIPETLLHTTLGSKKLADKVNIEIDTQTKVIVDTMERILSKCNNIRT